MPPWDRDLSRTSHAILLLLFLWAKGETPRDLCHSPDCSHFTLFRVSKHGGLPSERPEERAWCDPCQDAAVPSPASLRNQPHHSEVAVQKTLRPPPKNVFGLPKTPQSKAFKLLKVKRAALN